MKEWTYNNHDSYTDKKVRINKADKVRDSLYSWYLKEMSTDIIPLEVQLRRFKSTLK